MILFLFFCSGAVALVYEVVWSKYLTLLFGSTIQAQTVVLAVFMGGLALGNRLFGRWADQARRPLFLYGCTEICLATYALLFPFLYLAADGLFAAVGRKFLDFPNCLLLLKCIISMLLLIVPTVLMGGTLPLLAAWLQQTKLDARRLSARFYSTNSLGAVCGAGLGGLLLVHFLGLAITLGCAGVTNLTIGLAAVYFAKSNAFCTSGQTDASGPAARGAVETTRSAYPWECILVALTGAVSMSLEVLASRCLALVFGASLQVFAVVLMAFILGIGLGSAAIASQRLRIHAREMLLALMLLAPALALALLVFDIKGVAALYLYAQSGLTRTVIGYWYHQIFVTTASICFLGLPAASLGAVLPLMMRSGAESAAFLANRVGLLLTWNTLGAVVGVLITGFILMPWIGLRNSFAALGLALAGAVILLGLAKRRLVVGILGAACFLCLLYASLNGGQDWRNVLSAGIFRLQNMDFSGKASPLEPFFNFRRNSAKILFYEDAADATVSVENDLLSDGTTDPVLRINGKPDASAKQDRSTQLLLAQLPLMVRSQSQDVFCFGMGSGITAGSVLGYPVKNLTIAENCEPVLRAVTLFSAWNNGVYTNERTHIYHEDARTVLKLSPQQYDVIISEPSNPWMAGIGSVFSREFYQLAAKRLKPGGLMTQWFHIYEMDDATLYLVLRTFASVFRKMEIWDVGDNDIILMGSDQNWKTGPEVFARAFKLQQPRADLSSIGLKDPEAVLARQFASQQTAFAIPGLGPVQSDDRPILEYEAPKAFYIFLGREGIDDFPNYDERTWQMDLAPKEKNSLLARFSLQDLSPIFESHYVTGNPQLRMYLENRFQGSVGSLTIGDRIMPCVFHDPQAGIMVYEAPSAQTNLLARQLYVDEVALLGGMGTLEQSNAVSSIKEILDHAQDYQPERTGWPAAHYAAIAARASLRLGNAVQAKSILLRGLELDPGSKELSYLLRVVNGT